MHPGLHVAPTDTVMARVPCCGRAVRPFPFMQHAESSHRRTCPKCHKPWQVAVRPVGPVKYGFAHEVTWVARKSA